MNGETIVVWGLALGAVILPVIACRALISDARGGWETSMGGEMLFGNLWLFAGGLAGGAMVAAGFGWWWLIIGFVVFYLLAQPVRRVIKALYLGADLPEPPESRGGGFAAMDRKAGKRRSG